jgi:hypothetical protein
MADWLSRLKEAAYTSPTGDRIVFKYEDVSVNWTNKTSAFDFPGAQGTFVQSHHGSTSRRFPVRAIFTGRQSDRGADAFEELLRTPGVGKLEHPRYGTHDVVPFGEITREDRLKSAANQSIVEVVFFHTIGIAYPSSQVDPTNAVLSAVDLYNAAMAEDFANQVDISGVSVLVSLANTYKSLLKKAKSGLRKVAAAQQDIQDSFDDVIDGINAGIDVLIKTPLNIAFATTVLLQSPARALSSIGARLDAYGNLASDIFTSSDAISKPGGVGGSGIGNAGVGNDPEEPNKFQARNVFASTYVTGSVVSVVNAGSTDSTGAKSAAVVPGDATSDSGFKTKAEAIEAADVVLQQFADCVDWRDENYKSISGDGDLVSTEKNTDTGGSYQALQDAVALAAGFLVQISFTLNQERIITLDRERCPLDLVAEFYGETDTRLDQFIQQNNLSGDEHLLIPAGRKIAYYI